MRKTTISLITLLVIVIILACVPVTVGICFKKHYLTLIDDLNRNDRFHITVLKYDQGWVSSEAKLKVTLLAPNNQNNTPPNLNLLINSHIHHGPLVRNYINGGFTFAFASIDNDIFLHNVSAENIADKTVLVINTVATPFGRWYNKFVSPQANYSSPDKGSVTWDGMDAHIDFAMKDKQINEVNAYANIKPAIIDLTYQRPYNQQIITQTITYENHASKQLNDLWKGDTKITVPQLSVKKTDGANIELKNLVLTSRFGSRDPANYLYDNYLDLTIDSLIISNYDLPQIGPVKLHVGFENIDAKASQQFAELAKNMRHKPASRVDVLNAASLLSQAISANTNFEEEILLQTSSGILESKGKLYWLTKPLSMFDVMQNANLNFNLSIDISLVDKIIAIIASEYAKTHPIQPSVLTQPTPQLPIAKPAMNAEKVSNKENPLPTAPTPQVPITQASPPVNRSPDVMIKQFIANWIQEGYIVVDKNRYAITIIRENGAMTINGKVMNTTRNVPIR